MRKLIASLLAVTALVPAVAQAQDGRGSRFERQVNQIAREGRRADSGARVERQAQRAERQAARAARPDQPVAVDRRQDRQAARAERRDDRPNAGVERRQDRQEFRSDRRDDRQGFRQEARQDRADLARGEVTRREFRNDRRDDRQDFRAERRDDRQDFRRDGRGGNRNGDRLGGNDWDRSSFNRANNWNRGWRQDNRYDWNRYRGVNRQAYRLPRYYAPYNAGYGYRRFGIGVSLQSAFWGQNYWLNDPFAYRLPPAYGPYRWVRYYDDALLVDLRSGQVVDAVYGIFW